ncbi:MAG TPA: cobalamin-independent methionine synthase II family protein [Thermoleophilaceae bacterium]|jgi:5-methyltetrahydropteroyltriglutamate--homocysteine methyltransferase
MTTHHADVVGSLLAPPELAEVQSYTPVREISPEELRELQDHAIDDALAVQERAGVDVVTDGELRRVQFFDQFVTGMAGLAPGSGGSATFHSDDGEDVSFEVPVCVQAPIEFRRALAVEEFSYLKGKTERTIKVTIPSPLLLISVWNDELSRAAYADPFELFAAGVELIREQIVQLRELGCEYVQIDAPELIQGFADEQVQAERSAQGLDPERFMAEGIDYINAALDVPGIRRAVHLCRGNYAGMWTARGGYEDLARSCFARAPNVDVWMLEYDDDRSGGFEPLADLPDDKVAVLGLVTTKRAAMEDPARLRARIDEAARFHPREQLGISTQCGFESGTNAPLDAERQEDKLRLVADVAHQVWAHGGRPA